RLKWSKLHSFSTYLPESEELNQQLNQIEIKFKYYYVLTYIPDLHWCRIAPLQQKGFFGPDRRGRSGRKKWMLVPESEGMELDVSAERCEVVEFAYVAKGCEDADEEEWDIFEPEDIKNLSSNNNNNTKATNDIVESILLSSATSIGAPELHHEKLSALE